MRGTPDEETLRAKDFYEHLAAIPGARVCAYRAENGSFVYTQFKEAYQNFGKQIIHCGVGSHHQNTIFEHRINKLTLYSRTLLLHATGLWPEEVNTRLLPFSFKAACQSHNSLEMDEERKTLEKKFSGVNFQNFPTDFHTWGRPIFFIEAPLQGGPAGPPEWEPRERTRVYL